jgi:ABC-type multidrug transport system ATPase subunit/pSer/pThr/pTyr-binding forkhead associated (FHA) protein
MKCPTCGEANEAGFRFCRVCGHPMGEEDLGPTVAMPTRSSRREESTVTEAFGKGRSGRPTFRLMGVSGLLSGRTFSITSKGLLVGRDQSKCQIVLADDQISRQHAWVGLNEAGEVIVRDRESANGSYVNQVRVQEAVLKPNDEVSFGKGGKHLFRVESVAPAPDTVETRKIVTEDEVRTSLVNEADIAAAQQADRTTGGTVAIKLTELMARPHVDLIVDKFAVKTEDIPDQGLIIGRDPARCKMVLEHPSVSALHAQLSIKEGKVELTDHSANGTFVNGIRVKSTELQDGDYITFGRYSGKSLIFRSGLEPQLKMENIDLDRDHLVIGRDPGCDVVITHPVVSKKHAEIIKQNGKVLVVDLGSVNGTFVNGIRVKRHELQELDRVVIGPSELHFQGGSLTHVPDRRVVRLDSVHLNFQVTDRSTGQPKLLLDDLSLVVKPKELIGLLGPSGAGKTTLMNALNGFVKPTSGKVLYNGVDLYQNLDALKSTIGFVPQEDIMHRQLSVRRCLYYAAKLRLSDDTTEDEINHRVEEMLETLKLDPQRWDNPVATLSGGQRKRVSLGIELLPKPGVLFLDEPTAGLDPRTETLMMMLFRQLANQGSTIIITTHLLGSFGVLDKVVVLVQGRLAYFGPGTKFLEYFKADTPPDVYDDLTDNNTVPYSLELKKKFQDAPLYQSLVVEPQTAIPTESHSSAAGQGQTTQGKRFSLRQFTTLLQRTWELKFSDRAQTILLFAQAPLVALLVAMMASTPNQVQTIFMAMFSALWFGCSNAVREIVDEQTIYKRERQTGLKIPSYIFSKLSVLSFVAFVQCFSVVVICSLVNHAFELPMLEAGGAILILFLVALNGSLIGLLISGLVSTPEKALTIFPLVLIPELLLSGLFLPVGPIKTIIPVSIGQIYTEGERFGRKQSLGELEQMAKDCENVPYGVFGPPLGPGAPPPDPTAVAEAERGEFGHQVGAAFVPSNNIAKCFQRFTPAPAEGMKTPIRWFSALAISRWGLEALSDLCVHGGHSTGDAAYKILNTVSISLHPNDVPSLLEGLKGPPQFRPHDMPKKAGAVEEPVVETSEAFPLESHFLADKGSYLAIMAGYAALMLVLVLFVMKRKDVK